MAYQFAHMQLHSRSGCLSAEERERRTGNTSHGTSRAKGRRPIRSIFAELAREPGHCPHVEEPRPAIIVHDAADADTDGTWVEWPQDPTGTAASEAIRAAEERHDAIVANARITTSAGVVRRLPPQTLTLRADVYSWHEPVTVFDQPQHDPTLFQVWVADIVAHVCDEVEPLGATVEIAVLHMDEAHPHLHVLITHPTGLVGCLDPGRAAFEDAKAEGASFAKAKEAAAAAKRGWQDRLHERVGSRYGHARYGPRRQRLSRADWRKQCDAQAATRAQTTMLLKLTEECERTASALRALERNLSQANAAIMAAQTARQVAEADATEARREATKAVQQTAAMTRQLERGRNELSALRIRYRQGREEVRQLLGAKAEAQNDFQDARDQAVRARLDAEAVMNAAESMGNQADERARRIVREQTSLARRESVLEQRERELQIREKEVIERRNAVVASAGILRTEYAKRFDGVASLALRLTNVMDAMPPPLRDASAELLHEVEQLVTPCVLVNDAEGKATRTA